MAPLSMTLIDRWLRFQCRDIFRHWISQNYYYYYPHSYKKYKHWKTV